MNPKILQSLADLLRSGKLALLTEEVQLRREATARFRALLPDEVGAHLVSAHVSDEGVVVLTMDTAAWAARARYCAEHLGVEHVRVRVAPSGR